MKKKLSSSTYGTVEEEKEDFRVFVDGRGVFAEKKKR